MVEFILNSYLPSLGFLFQLALPLMKMQAKGDPLLLKHGNGNLLELVALATQC